MHACNHCGEPIETEDASAGTGKVGGLFPQRNRHETAGKFDKYYTPDACASQLPLVIRMLIDSKRIHSEVDGIWEFAAGGGALVRTLVEAGYKVTATDIAPDAGSGYEAVDMLTAFPSTGSFCMLASNPPYNCLAAVIERCLYMQLPFVLLVRVEHLLTNYMRGVLDSNRCVVFFLHTSRVKFVSPDGVKAPVDVAVCWIAGNLRPLVPAMGGFPVLRLPKV